VGRAWRGGCRRWTVEAAVRVGCQLGCQSGSALDGREGRGPCFRRSEAV
jgi:hypothetical protein